MSKVILTADWHITKGLRVSIILEYLEYLKKYYFENKIEHIFVLGDIFDKSSSIKNDIFIPLFMKLFEMKKAGVNFTFIVGNHDIFNVDNDSIVETFSPFGEVIKEEKTIEYLGREITLLPYTKDINKVPKVGDLLFTHLSIADFTFDNNYHVTEKMAFPKNTFENFNQVFTGHFHRHQTYKNITYIGSPCQMNRGEMGQEKGFIVLDLKNDYWDFIKYKEAPVFIEINTNNIKDIENIDLNNKMAVINIDRKIEDYSKLRYILLEKGAVDIIPIFETIEEDKASVEEVNFSSNLQDIVIEYININYDEKVLKIFERVLEEV